MEQKNDQKAKILVETNFKVYIYSNSIFQIKILQLFVVLKYRFSNLAVGVITRESTRLWIF